MDVMRTLRDLVDETGSQTAAAKKLGISLPYLNDILHGRREPGVSVLDALGVERVVTYREKQEQASA